MRPLLTLLIARHSRRGRRLIRPLYSGDRRTFSGASSCTSSWRWRHGGDWERHDDRQRGAGKGSPRSGRGDRTPRTRRAPTEARRAHALGGDDARHAGAVPGAVQDGASRTRERAAQVRLHAVAVLRLQPVVGDDARIVARRVALKIRKPSRHRSFVACCSRSFFLLPVD